jgi:GntR family transcriptional regulator
MAVPLYRRIADDLRGQINSGQLAPGAQLPPEDRLKERFAASRNTIRDAVKLLVALGLVETRPGQGTFVVDRPDPLITTLTTDRVTGLGGGEGAAYRTEARERHPKVSTPMVELQTAKGEIARRLGVDEGTPLVSRHERRFIGAKRADQIASDETQLTPWSMQTSFYPRSFALRGAERLLDNEDISQGTVRYLEETLNIKQVGYRDWITVRAPDQNEVAFFGLPADGRVPVYEIFRTAFDQNGTPMRLTVTIFPADRNQFIIDVGDVPAREYEPAPTAS